MRQKFEGIIINDKGEKKVFTGEAKDARTFGQSLIQVAPASWIIRETKIKEIKND